MNIESNNLNKIWEELNTSSHSIEELFNSFPPPSIPNESLIGPFFVIPAEQSIPPEQRTTTANFTSSEELDINVENLVDSIRAKLNELNSCISSDEHIYCPNDYDFVQSHTTNISALLDQIIKQMNLLQG